MTAKKPQPPPEGERMPNRPTSPPPPRSRCQEPKRIGRSPNRVQPIVQPLDAASPLSSEPSVQPAGRLLQGLRTLAEREIKYRAARDLYRSKKTWFRYLVCLYRGTLFHVKLAQLSKLGEGQDDRSRPAG